ncbi:U11/U12 small nuclear ribonucleoprotein 35 kDa protein-like [Anneissia japonica]|uniref:U11/U12 small nuclear ribonucleoprotein 35 kDa protein-like n=1 Tax=Anneissia japonica TaxID=1529436 RepID=UPI001425BA2A|nr:U11/U12 small nuclear ribonucleoprotein 35 kDa protein-like [Anneissia japonica]
METQWSAIALVYNPLKAGSIDGTDERPHDRAVERALKARYNPDKSLKSSPESSVFITRLNLNTTEETLQEAFSRYGEIRNLRLVRDIVTGFSKCYAFIEYSDSRDAYRAIDEANHMYIDGHEIYVDNEIERTLEGWIPRRLGGGFGGKKESGQLRFGGNDRPFKKPIILSQKYDTQDKEQNYRHTDRYSDQRRDRDRERRRSRDRERRRSRDRERHRSRDRERCRSRDRERRRSRDRERRRSRSREKHRDRDRDSDKYRERDRDNDMSKERNSSDKE